MAIGVPTDTGLPVLAGYGAIYLLPCLVLLVIGAVHATRVRQRLQRVRDRIGRARAVPRSVPAALSLVALSAVVAIIGARV